MRNIEEQITEIQRRENAQRREKGARRIGLFTGLSCTACLCLIVAVAQVLPTLQIQMSGQTSVYYGTAIMGNPVVGFTIIVLLAFALGVCLTLLCLTVRRRKNRRDGR